MICRRAITGSGLAFLALALAGAHPATAQTLCTSGRTLQLKAHPNVTIGTDFGAESEQFDGVFAAAELSGGSRVVIGNSRPPELRYFNASGKHIRTVGGRGSGPGEFQMMGLFTPGENDSVFVGDPPLKRLSVFGPDGGFVRSFRPDAVGVGLLRIHYLGQGRIAIIRLANARATADVGIVRDSLIVAIHETGGKQVAPVGRFPGLEGSTISTARGVRFEHVGFARGLLTAAGGGRLFIADNARYLIDIYDLHGRKVRTLGNGATGRVVTAEDKRRYLEFRGNRRPQTVFPPRHPTIKEMIASRSGMVWVRRYDVPWSNHDALWDVFGSSGVAQCTVRISSAARLLGVRDSTVVVAVKDTLGVERISSVSLEVMRRSP